MTRHESSFAWLWIALFLLAFLVLPFLERGPVEPRPDPAPGTAATQDPERREAIPACAGCDAGTVAVHTAEPEFPDCASVSILAVNGLPLSTEGECVHFGYLVEFDFSACDPRPLFVELRRWRSWTSDQPSPVSHAVTSEGKVAFLILESVPCGSGERWTWYLDGSETYAAESWTLCTACEVPPIGK